MANITATRTKERIDKNGEVFTPPELVQEILQKIKDTQPELFTNKNKTFCDPAAGEGAFLVEVLDMKLKAGHPPLDALRTVYGVELEPENVERCKELLCDVLTNNGHKVTKRHNKVLDTNIVCSDAFEWDFENWRPLGSPQAQVDPQIALIESLIGTDY